MTEIGLCHNASFAETRLTPELARELRPTWARTIVYNRPDSREAVIASAQELARVGVRSLVVFNTESYDGAIDDLGAYAAALEALLVQAGGAIAAIEPGNELDTPGWTDSRGRPVSDDLIIAIGRRAAAVCHRHDTLCLSPSLLSGPEEGRFARVAAGLKGYVDAMAIHPYYCSVGGRPREGWRFGSLEAKAQVCRQLGAGLPIWFTECGCPTIFDDIGPAGQQAWTAALRAFNHPTVEVAFQFALSDAVGGPAELSQGKDWGLIGADGRRKPAFSAFCPAGPGPVATPPETPRFVLGFARWAALEPDLLGQPLENEWTATAGLSQQLTTTGLLTWAAPRDGEPTYTFYRLVDRSRHLWRDDWPASKPVPT